MHARLALAFLLVAVSAGSVGSAPSERAGDVVWPEGFLESLQGHADPGAVLRLMGHKWEAAAVARGFAPRPVPGAIQGDRTFRRSEREYADVPIAATSGALEFGPSLAANPRRQNVVVSAHTVYSDDFGKGRCAVRRSLDRGSSWSAPVFLPTLSESPTLSERSACDGAVLGHSWDGRTLFAAYRDFRSVVVPLQTPPGASRMFMRSAILVSRSSDDGASWSVPVVAIDSDAWSIPMACPGCPMGPGETLERPSLATGSSGADGNWVYVTANSIAIAQPASAPPSAAVFVRSGDGGMSWFPRQTLDEGTPATPASPRELAQGSRVAAGRTGDVLVAWYHSGPSGQFSSTFEIRTRWSRNHGGSWDDYVVAVQNEWELGPSLGGLRSNSWWVAMFPDLRVDDFGRAHLVYTSDPVAGSSTAEEGDIRYASSPRAPFTNWTTPETVSDDTSGRAQGYPSLAVRRLGHLPILEVAWEDCRLAAAGNASYDIFHSRRIPGRWGTWSWNRRVSDASSSQNANSTGERVGIVGSHSGLVFAAWTDRRGVVSPGVAGLDVYGSRIAR